MSTILDQIVASKRIEITRARSQISEAALEQQLPGLPPPRDFRTALEEPPGVRVIAEVKKASPSAGALLSQSHFDPVAIAQTYENHGAACISVLTDAPFFQGKLADLKTVRQAVQLPLLRKDFILERYQLLEARLAGADAVLLIAEILTDSELKTLQNQAADLGMQTLVEFYDPANLSRVVDSGARLIGINNRDLRTFQTNLDHTLELASRLPAGVCVVSESGIRSFEDVKKLAAGGVRAILVGETLMRAKNPGLMLESLLGGPVIFDR